MISFWQVEVLTATLVMHTTNSGQSQSQTGRKWIFLTYRYTVILTPAWLPPWGLVFGKKRNIFIWLSGWMTCTDAQLTWSWSECLAWSIKYQGREEEETAGEIYIDILCIRFRHIHQWRGWPIVVYSCGVHSPHQSSTDEWHVITRSPPDKLVV